MPLCPVDENCHETVKRITPTVHKLRDIFKAILPRQFFDPARKVICTRNEVETVSVGRVVALSFGNL